MIRKFTRKVRQQIVDEFASRHGGVFDPKQFLREVRASNGTHPAWAFFEWRDHTAAEEFRIDQARQFVQGLTIKFEVKVTQRSVGGIVVREVPAYVSPVGQRQNGGGYIQVDPNNPELLEEIRRQGVTALETWVKRFSGAFLADGFSTQAIESELDVMRSNLRPKK